ncbi:MAG: sugar phosphate isomerase/epimerase [Clostridia bacterium]|nr:sugar phosphate isomerase/epimerase [Clostridia bacterium]
MNKIAVQTGGPEERYGIDGAYRLIKECGFDAVDANVDHLLTGKDIKEDSFPSPLIDGKGIKELFAPWGDAAKKYGIDNFQAHAPFPSYVYGNDDINRKLLLALENTIRGCDSIECRNLIIHPFFLGYDRKLSAEQEWDLNIRSYSALIPSAKEYGVTICLENMFTGYKGKMYSACCSDIDYACRMTDELNRIAGEKLFGFCLDTGHMLLCGLDAKETVTKLGKRISAFHIHDNDGRNDQHLAPYMGILDWDRLIEGIKEIGYKDTLSFETFNVWNVVDNEVMPSMLKFISECGRMFARRIAG